MKHVIVGYGEVGKAISAIIPESWIQDPNLKEPSIIPAGETFDVMHICFPYIDSDFVYQVRQYQERFKPHLTIIHSSVPIGTSDDLGAVHSPIRGVHPHLEKGIRTFVKYFGGMKAFEAAHIFAERGIDARIVRDARNMEAAKLWDTTQYGVMIMLEKEIYDFCRSNGLDFELVYGEFNETYNAGYTKLNMSHVVRPALMHKPGKIGGHCVVENAALLDTPTARRIIEQNSHL